MVGALEQLNGSPGAQVAAADADDHEHVGGLRDLLGGGTNPADFLGLLCHRQVQPAQKIVAFAAALGEGLVGVKNFLLGGQQVRQGQLTPHIGNVYFNHSFLPSFHG